MFGFGKIKIVDYKSLKSSINPTFIKDAWYTTLLKEGYFNGKFIKALEDYSEHSVHLLKLYNYINNDNIEGEYLEKNNLNKLYKSFINYNTYDKIKKLESDVIKTDDREIIESFNQFIQVLLQFDKGMKYYNNLDIKKNNINSILNKYPSIQGEDKDIFSKILNIQYNVLTNKKINKSSSMFNAVPTDPKFNYLSKFLPAKVSGASILLMKTGIRQAWLEKYMMTDKDRQNTLTLLLHEIPKLKQPDQRKLLECYLHAVHITSLSVS